MEYRTAPSGKWQPALVGQETVEHLLDSQFDKYLKDVEAAARVSVSLLSRACARRD